MRMVASGGDAVLVVVGVRLGMRVNQGLGPGVGVGELVGDGVMVKVAKGVLVGGTGVAVFMLNLITGVSEISWSISSVTIWAVAEDVTVGATGVGLRTSVVTTCVADEISCVAAGLEQPVTNRVSSKHDAPRKIKGFLCLEGFSNCILLCLGLFAALYLK
jgi:hypothetical protein